jgi:pullulanase/glycogen debranching enzyme
MRHPVATEHLQMLGVTALELMPIHQLVRDHAIARGQTLADPREEASRSVQGRGSAYKA